MRLRGTCIFLVLLLFSSTLVILRPRGFLLRCVRSLLMLCSLSVISVLEISMSDFAALIRMLELRKKRQLDSLNETLVQLRAAYLSNNQKDLAAAVPQKPVVL